MSAQPDLRARSPWAALQGIEVVEISPPATPVNASLRIPGSKSFTNRALLLAGVAKGESTLGGILKSDDSYWCLDVLTRLGIKSELRGDDQIVIRGCAGNWPNKSGELYIGAAGTTARFLPGLLAADSNGDWQITASTSMSERPIAGVIDALNSLGADISYFGERPGYLPIKIAARGLNGGSITMSGKTSSQFISGAIMAASLARSPTTINIVDDIVQRAYVDITIELMKQFGAVIERSADFSQFSIYPITYCASNLALEADASTSCYFLSAAALSTGYICIENLSPYALQPDVEFLDILARMGCVISKNNSSVALDAKHFGTGKRSLSGGFEIDLKKLSDQTMTLAVLACFADAPITIKNVAHIRHHECDRISAICKELNRAGVNVTEHQDGLTVNPAIPKPVCFDSYDDHRMAMSLSLLGVKVPGVKIKDPGCVSKTCPDYFALLRKIGTSVNYNKN